MKTTLLTLLMVVFAISVYAQQVTRDQVVHEQGTGLW